HYKNFASSDLRDPNRKTKYHSYFEQRLCFFYSCPWSNCSSKNRSVSLLYSYGFGRLTITHSMNCCRYSYGCAVQFIRHVKITGKKVTAGLIFASPLDATLWRRRSDRVTLQTHTWLKPLWGLGGPTAPLPTTNSLIPLISSHTRIMGISVRRFF
ncbi:unnamed protein product, partial [Brassica rapa]